MNSCAGAAAACDDGSMAEVGSERRDPDTQSATNAEPATDARTIIDGRPVVEALPAASGAPTIDAQAAVDSGPAIDAQPAVEGRPSLKPHVGPPKLRGVRPVFLIALGAALVLPVVMMLWIRESGHPYFERSSTASTRRSALPSGCTSLEVEETIRNPAMDDIDRVTCLAVAGKIDRARATLRALPASTQAEVVARVFAVAHPIADRGDDESAGPIMKLVVEFWPQNYMAVFHAGMSDFALGRDDTAKHLLEDFLQMYAPQDVWRARAERALAAIAAHAPLDQREAHFPE
jgi:hypothetical protein